jgi:hypothetical protein
VTDDKNFRLVRADAARERAKRRFEPLVPPPVTRLFTEAHRRAWDDIVAAAPGSLRNWHGDNVHRAAVLVAGRRAGMHATRGDLREIYRLLGQVGVPRREWRRLLLPERPPK